ncbi:hypothetical protein COO60DRAFT_1698696 [Scenedesmus sp. NREL 46B-D3]|nr:hypothetical protein COO60DRAFT_1698696 [Scenedesmus sp. NREL 46B-D3]
MFCRLLYINLDHSSWTCIGQPASRLAAAVSLLHLCRTVCCGQMWSAINLVVAASIPNDSFNADLASHVGSVTSLWCLHMQLKCVGSRPCQQHHQGACGIPAARLCCQLFSFAPIDLCHRSCGYSRVFFGLQPVCISFVTQQPCALHLLLVWLPASLAIVTS